MEELDTATEAVADESVLVDEQPAESPPPAVDPETPEQAAEKTKSQLRREQRKAAEQRLEARAQEAEDKARRLEAERDKLLKLTEGDKEPKEADFASYELYQAALYAHAADKRFTQRELRSIEADAETAKQEAQRIQQERLKERADHFEAQVSDARDRYADFDVVRAVAARSDIVAPHIAEMVLEQDASADLTYYLGTHPDIARQLSSMPPLRAAIELGRIEAKLTLPEPKLVSSAPPPINPVRSSGGPSKDPETMTYAEYAAWRAAGGKP